MATIKDALASMNRNIEEKTGIAVSGWVERIRKQHLDGHKLILSWLKTEHGLSHGYANHLALQARNSGYRTQRPSELLRQQYSGPKASLRPIYDRIAELAAGLGPDVELVPKKQNVSVRRRKQFALIQPSTATRVDLGLILRAARATKRLEPTAGFNAMFTHRVRLVGLADVDDQVHEWLQSAYANAV